MLPLMSCDARCSCVYPVISSVLVLFLLSHAGYSRTELPFYETGPLPIRICQYVSLSINYKLEIRWEFPGATRDGCTSNILSAVNWT